MYLSMQASSLSINPLLQNQSGIINGRLVGGTDAARGAPQTVRFANAANTNTASWTTEYGGATITTGVADRDGGTNAASVSQSSGGANVLYFGSSTLFNGLPAAGDWIICGAWVRSAASFTPPNGQGGPGGGSSIICQLVGSIYYTQYNLFSSASYGGDGEWEWVWQAFKVSNTTGSTHLQFGGNFTPTWSATFYGPVANRIPAGTLSDGEVANMAINLRSYSNTCSVGQICDAVGRLVHTDIGTCTMSSGACSTQILSHSWASAPSCIGSWTGTGTLTGLLKFPSTTTTVTPASSVGTDTAQVNWQCSGN